MPGRERRQSLRIVGWRIAAPDDVHVGPQQDEIAPIDIAGARVGDVEAAKARSRPAVSACEPPRRRSV
jgi:hypothetical protein